MKRFSNCLNKVILIGLSLVIVIPLVPIPISAATVNFPWGGGPANVGGQSYPYSHTVNSDENGNVFSFKHQGDGGIIVQKTDKYGNGLWPGDGVTVFTSSGPSPQTSPREMTEGVSDGAGGVFVIWSLASGGPPATYIQ